MNQTEENLFEAYLAGFDASGEGYNGEYHKEPYELVTEELREEFDRWLERRISPDA